jgi:hypothetical protein
MGLNFRKLKAHEIKVRIQSVKKNGLILLIYKDARVDMNILDETVGPENWQRKHELINTNLFCNVEIWDDTKNQWVSKSDVGVESNAEKEKGQASDSFKRACFNWGIGRELYESPFIWVKEEKCNIKEYNKKLTCSDKFNVEKITYTKLGNVDGLAIINSKTKGRVFVKKPSESKEI